MSTTSLGDANTCPLTHQYHYIQYPYYHHANQAPPSQQVGSTSTTQLGASNGHCHCCCSCGHPSVALHPQSPPFGTPNGLGRPLARCYTNQDSDSQVAVAVIVHQQSGGASGGPDGGGGGGELTKKARSEQSLLNHSYQALQLHPGSDSLAEEKPLNVARGANITSQANLHCECDLECTCGAAAVQPKSKHNLITDAMLSADEITVSESDNNSTMIKKKKDCDCLNLNDKFGRCAHSSSIRVDKTNSSQMDIYSDGDDCGNSNGNGESAEACLKRNESRIDEDHRPPLPPRPPPRPRNVVANSNGNHHRGTGIKKYVVWCLVCGGCSCLLGILHLLAYFLLHSYTITVGNFETVPTFVPATLLILTGLCIMSLARRRNRYSYLIKLSGACGLISALTCALVTVTTTVLHMSRLQALRECEYAQKTRTCTCYSDMAESQVDRVDKGVRLVFDSLSDCGVVHGSLYSCLRAIFGLSVAGVLIAVFSCMLVYQLLSHERKKMYWEQLELRCRSLYTSQQGQPNVSAVAGSRGMMCRCCEQCHHVHRQTATYPWDDGAEPRFWTGQPPGNFYSPNPGSDELHLHVGASGTCRGHAGPSTRSRVGGWSWPRMPWQRNSPDPNARFQTPSSPDSQYGFSNSVPAGENLIVEESAAVPHNPQAYNVVAGNLPYGVWGPPPPYDPNSPIRRGYYQFMQSSGCGTNGTGNAVATDRDGTRSLSAHASEQRIAPCLNHRSAFLDQPSGSACCAQTSSLRNVNKRQASSNGYGGHTPKTKGDYENTPSDSDGGARFSNTLPTRKIKKRVEAGAKSIGPHSQLVSRASVQQVFSGSEQVLSGDLGEMPTDDQKYGEPPKTGDLGEDAAIVGVAGCSVIRAACNQSQSRSKRGVENSAFQTTAECDADGSKDALTGCDPTESEVYFADVSSCCNMSVKNDNYYEDASHTNRSVQHHHHQTGQQAQPQVQVQVQSTRGMHQLSECGPSTGSGSGSGNSDNYLTQRFGQRENSIRSRLPFPQGRGKDYEDNLNVSPTNLNHNNNNNINSNSNNNNNNNNNSICITPTDMNQMQKEISRQSMCSMDSDAKTEFTDLSPSTPCSNKFAQTNFASAMVNASGNSNGNTNRSTTPTGHHKMPPHLNIEMGAPDGCTPPNFVASFPFSSESQSFEAHRRPTKSVHELRQPPQPEVHYEVINDSLHSQFGMVASMPHGKSGASNHQQSQVQQQQQCTGRSMNLNGGSKRGDGLHGKLKTKSRNKERLNVGSSGVGVGVGGFPKEMNWADGGGGGSDRRL